MASLGDVSRYLRQRRAVGKPITSQDRSAAWNAYFDTEASKQIQRGQLALQSRSLDITERQNAQQLAMQQEQIAAQNRAAAIQGKMQFAKMVVPDLFRDAQDGGFAFGGASSGGSGGAQKAVGGGTRSGVGVQGSVMPSAIGTRDGGQAISGGLTSGSNIASGVADLGMGASAPSASSVSQSGLGSGLGAVLGAGFKGGVKGAALGAITGLGAVPGFASGFLGGVVTKGLSVLDKAFDTTFTSLSTSIFGDSNDAFGFTDADVAAAGFSGGIGSTGSPDTGSDYGGIGGF